MRSVVVCVPVVMVMGLVLTDSLFSYALIK